MDYNIVESDTIAVLLKKVNDHIELGWLPIGGVAPIRPHTSGPVHYYQAVYKSKSAPGIEPVFPIRQPKRKYNRRAPYKPRVKAVVASDPGSRE